MLMRSSPIPSVSRYNAFDLKEEQAMPKVKVELEQLAQALRALSPVEPETLELLLNPELTDELKRRWQEGREALAHGETLSEKELFASKCE
jgi:post-segregation antitoxin (ccd killing protein)